MSRSVQNIIRKVQVNIPFRMLDDSYLERFLEYGLNPEIGIDAAALEGFTFADFKRIGKILHDHALTLFPSPFTARSSICRPDPPTRR